MTMKQMLLPVDLTDGDVLEVAAELAALEKQLEERKDAKKAAAKTFNDAIKDIEARIRESVKAIDTKQREEMVDCKLVADADKFEMVMNRMDTGDEVHRRPMTEKERLEHGQLSLVPPEAEDGSEEPEAAEG